MNDEIKEILEHLKEYLQNKIDNGEHKIFYNDLMWDEKTIDCINAIDDTLDYITNLQQENERLKEENKHIFANVNDDELLISNAMNYAEAQDYKSRCEKAIEYNKEIVNNYLEEDNCEYCDGRYATAKHNLNILQNGSENDE